MLPITREETATPASPVKSATINAIQDALISAAGLRTIPISPALYQPDYNDPPQFDYAGPRWNHGTHTGRLIAPFTVIEVGATIESWYVHINKGSASGTVTARLIRRPFIGGAPILIGTVKSNNANNPGDIVLSEAANHIVLADNAYSLMIEPSGITGDFSMGAQYNLLPYAPPPAP